MSIDTIEKGVDNLGVWADKTNIVIENLVPLGAVISDLSADIAPQLQAALDAGERSISLPPQRLLWGSAVDVPAGTTIIGSGDETELYATSDDLEMGLHDGFFTVDVANVTLANFSLDGRYTGGAFVAARSSGVALLDNSSNCTIQNVKTVNTMRHGIMVLGSDHLISACRMTNSSADCLGIGSGALATNATFDIKVVGCYMNGSENRGAAEINDGCHRVYIDDCVFTGTVAASNDLFSINDHSRAGESNTDLFITNSTFDDSANGYRAIACSSGTGNLHERIFISNCYFKSAAAGLGIFMADCDNIYVNNCTFDTVGSVSALYEEVNNVNFSDCVMIGSGSATVAPDIGDHGCVLFIETTVTADEVRFTNNKISGFGNAPFLLRAGGHITISDNYISECNQSVNSVGPAFYVKVIDHATVDGNRIINTTETISDGLRVLGDTVGADYTRAVGNSVEITTLTGSAIDVRASTNGTTGDNYEV